MPDSARRPAIAAAFGRDGRRPDPAQEKVLSQLAGLADALLARARPFAGWRRPPPVPGLYLWGGVGRGKTALLDALLAILPSGLACRYHQHRLLDDFHRTAAGDGRAPDFEERLNRLVGSSRLLVLDEFHAYDPADAAILHRLLARLFARGTTLALSANHRPAELWPQTARHAAGTRHFAPLAELLSKHCRLLEVDGGRDYRQGAAAVRWWSPATPLAQQQAAAWYAGTGGPAEGFQEFSTLCGGHFCHADYRPLVERLPALVLQGLPRFGPTDGDALRRLIWLLDAAWEAGLPLAVTATAPPDETFADIGPALRQLLGRDLARTRSRLHGLSALPV